MPNNPWLGVTLVIIGVITIVVFTLLKVTEVSVGVGIVTIGIAIVQGFGHQQTKQELTTLRASMRPKTGSDFEKESKQVFPPESDTSKIERLLK